MALDGRHIEYFLGAAPYEHVCLRWRFNDNTRPYSIVILIEMVHWFNWATWTLLLLLKAFNNVSYCIHVCLNWRSILANTGLKCCSKWLCNVTVGIIVFRVIPAVFDIAHYSGISASNSDEARANCITETRVLKVILDHTSKSTCAQSGNNE